MNKIFRSVWDRLGSKTSDKPKEEIHPNLQGYQLLGDSQFVRFSKQILGYNKVPGRSINYCVSGQTTEDLFNLLKTKQFPLHNKVIVMIGTNDLLRHKPMEDIKFVYKKLVKQLKKKAKKIVLVSVPPIPLQENSFSHWGKVQTLNSYIKELCDDKKLFFVDISESMLERKHKCDIEYFEKFYGRGPRKDLIHLNRKGLSTLRDEIVSQYFERI